LEGLEKILGPLARLTIAGAPEGQDALAIGAIARRVPVLAIVREEARMAALARALDFFAPDVEVVAVPAWDCLPYDRVSPGAEIVSRRMDALSRLASRPADAGPLVVIASVDSALQRVVARAQVAGASFRARPGERMDLDKLVAYLAGNGYERTGTVMEPGEYAVRGGIVDVYPPGADEAIRLDLFGDVLEAVRTFDPLTQRTTGTAGTLDLVPASELSLDTEAVSRFRTRYVELFGAVTDEDALYEAVSAGRRHPGVEHWLPLFEERMDTLLDYVPDALLVLDPLADDAVRQRLDTIADYYEARVQARRAGTVAGAVYKPVPPEQLYVLEDEWRKRLAARRVRDLSGFGLNEGLEGVDLGARPGRDFAPERNQPGINLFDALAGHLSGLVKDGKRPVIACASHGSRDRLAGVLADHGIQPVRVVAEWREALRQPRAEVTLVPVNLEHGFTARDLAVIAEQDILGDRLIRPPKRRRPENFLRDATALSQGDLVVHVDHGIGRFEGLKTLDVAGAPHDCLHLVYDGGDKLFVPVENIEVLSRYGSGDTEVALDKLGGVAWQQRKARLKNRIREMADELIRVAAERALKTAEVMGPAHGLYEEFCARFPYEETEDQERAIADVVDDLGAGRPMDRLVCGDVGFGKTEVALRAAFVAALAGRQVAVVTPTTLLCRQHYRTFTERFAGLPVTVRQLSRLVSSKEATETRKGLKEGQVDIVVGTHALLGKAVQFKDLGLLIVDEEQHFGVAHKERLKQLATDVHVLTLTATPIPRTLQLAMSGVRALSIIATPPVDRLAIRTFFMPFDPVVVREALLREHYRGGQTFYVCPRITDLDEVAEFLTAQVPEVRWVKAHGQMAPSEIEDVMTAFYDGKYDVLLSTTIVESGLDIPTANTLVVHCADMFGLAQLYQIRGRIGRSKQRAYAYLTVPPRHNLTAAAEKRLHVLQTLDELGAGFTLASHDLDIRGAGNLLGEEQSGHIREVGFELYQEMLEEAMAQARAHVGKGTAQPDDWSPQIGVGAAVLIPDEYVADLDVRMDLYRRIARLADRPEIDSFAAELIDRFGPLPTEVDHLLKIVEIKRLAKKAGIEKIDAGPKGATIAFRNQSFGNTDGLIGFIAKSHGLIKPRPDHKLVYLQDWATPEARLAGALYLARSLADIASAPPPTPASKAAAPPQLVQRGKR
jgi:transcription-repair coupling factor (superfamily II helicase)